MANRVVSYAQIECDSCGRRREDVALDATVARINASRDGWRFIVWNIKDLGLQKRKPSTRHDGWELETVPRQWDCCPDCPVPESPTEAEKIRAERKTYVGGKWVDKEQGS